MVVHEPIEGLIVSTSPRLLTDKGVVGDCDFRGKKGTTFCIKETIEKIAIRIRCYLLLETV